MKTTRLASLAVTALSLAGSNALAVDITLYGQVNKALVVANDGLDTNVLVTDNMLSSTRFGFKGSQPLDNGLTASVLFEGEMSSDPSNGFIQNNASGSSGNSTVPSATSPAFAERQAHVGLSGDFGGIYLGQQSTAIDGVYTQDLTGAQDVMMSDYTKFGGAYNFRTDGTNALNSTITTKNLAYGSATNREDSVRYDSPVFHGLQGRASVAQGGNAELSAFYEGGWQDFKIKGAAGVQFVNSSTTVATNALERQYAGSISVQHTSGLGATVAYAAQSLENKTSSAHEAEGWYAKLGYTKGPYEFAADYGKSDHFTPTTFATTSKAEVSTYGLGAQYNLGKGVSVGALYRNESAKVTGTDLQDIDLYAANMRVRF